MTTAHSRALRCATAVVVAALPQCGVPAARAVSPPPIDSSQLPEPAPPRPPQPTVQREMCAVPSITPDAGRANTSGQLSGLDLPQVWKLTRGSGQRVAVIDTGVAPHSRLPKTAAGGDYVFTGDGTQDCDGHGTAVAGIIAAATDPHRVDDFSGVAPDVSLISIRQSSTKFGAVADPSNSGFGDVSTMAKAVRTAADLGASVINISSVACIRTGSTLDDRALGAALSYAVDVKNVVVVVAAGNTGTGQCPAQSPQPTWDTVTVVVSPAWYDDYVLTVGSVNARGEPSSFTLAGPWVDVAAPGEGVISLSSSGDGLVNSLGGPNGSSPLSGTSYAAPVVSGSGGVDPIPVPEADGSPGDATHRGHRASSARRVGSSGRRGRCRLPCRRQHRPTGKPGSSATTHTGADCAAAASCAGAPRFARHGVHGRSDLRWRVGGSADHRRTDGPTTASRESTGLNPDGESVLGD